MSSFARAVLNHAPDPVFGLVDDTPRLPEKLAPEHCWADAPRTGSKDSIRYLAEGQDKAFTGPALAKINNVDLLTTCSAKTLIIVKGILV